MWLLIFLPTSASRCTYLVLAVLGSSLTTDQPHPLLALAARHLSCVRCSPRVAPAHCSLAPPTHFSCACCSPHASSLCAASARACTFLVPGMPHSMLVCAALARCPGSLPWLAALARCPAVSCVLRLCAMQPCRRLSLGLVRPSITCVCLAARRSVPPHRRVALTLFLCVACARLPKVSVRGDGWTLLVCGAACSCVTQRWLAAPTHYL